MNYPTSEVRGGGTNYLMPEVRGTGREELPHPRGQGRQPRGATPCPRSGEAGGTTSSRRSGEELDKEPGRQGGVTHGPRGKRWQALTAQSWESEQWALPNSS